MKYDKHNMIAMIASLPKQISEMIDSLLEWEPNEKFEGISNIVICGMGGSAIAGDLICNMLKDELSIPIYVVRDYYLPSWVDNRSMVILSSYSGNTEETLSCLEDSLNRKAISVCVTTGGTLHAKSKELGLDCIIMPTGYQPRAALGYSLISMMFVLEKFELINNQFILDNIGSYIDEITSYGKELLDSDSSLSKELSEKIINKKIIIYGVQGTTDVIAYRLRCQIAENSKILCFHHVIPEMNHNEIEGWNKNQNSDDTIVIWFTDEEVHLRNKKRIEVTSELLSQLGSQHEIISVSGSSRCIRLIKLVQLCDYISFDLAMLNKMDPTPVDRIAEMKVNLDK